MQFWPQLTIIAMSIAALGITAYKHGETYTQKPPTFRGWVLLLVQLALLACGGFFRPTLPFFLFCAFVAMGIGLVIRDDGKPATHKIFTTFFAQMILHGLWYWGGFYDSFLQQ